MRKYVEVFFGRRDYYQPAVALLESGQLDKLFADFYSPDILARTTKFLPNRIANAIGSRYAQGLSSRFVSCPILPRYVLARMAMKFGASASDSYKVLDHIIGFKAGKYYKSKDLGALVYSYYWKGFLQGLGPAVPSYGPRVVYQVHPVASQVREILGRDKMKTGMYSVLDPDEKLSIEEVIEYENLVKQADGIVVSSSFVKQGLVNIGYPPERIFVIPYGSEFSVRGMHTSPASAKERKVNGRPLRLLWVGQLMYRKGVHHLFDALKQLPKGSVQLTMVCRTRPDRLFMDMAPECVKILDGVSDDALRKIYEEHDVFIMPSLIEGFGLVYLEALRMGMPIIATPNSGVPDIITDGREGFIVEAGSSDQIVSVITKILNNDSLVTEMSICAREAGYHWNWERYRQGIRQALSSLESNMVTLP